MRNTLTLRHNKRLRHTTRTAVPVLVCHLPSKPLLPSPPEFFASSSSSSRVRRSIDWILISVLHVVCGRSARDPRTVREKIFRVDSPWFNHGQSDFRGAALLVRSVFSYSPRVVAGRSASPSRTVRRSHTDSPHRLLQFRVWASVLVCLLPFLVPRLLGCSFEVVCALFGILFVRVGSWRCDWGIGRIQPKGRFFIGSHSLPPLWSPESVLQLVSEPVVDSFGSDKP
jgi:hypothetical protein